MSMSCDDVHLAGSVRELAPLPYGSSARRVPLEPDAPPRALDASGRGRSFTERRAEPGELFDATTYARLRGVKAEYDPDDVIRGNHSIPPA